MAQQLIEAPLAAASREAADRALNDVALGVCNLHIHVLAASRSIAAARMYTVILLE